MNERTKAGLEILQTAVLMGVLGNVLLRQTPWGINAFLFVAAFTVSLVILTVRRRRELLTARSIAIQCAMVFFGAMFVFRDEEELLVFDTFAIIILMGVLILSNFGINARIAGVFHYAAGTIWSGINSAFGSLALLGADIDWKDLPGNRLSKSIFSVLRGLAIALPLLLIFGALFMAADAAFEGVVNRFLNFDIDVVISNVLLTAVFAWLTAGYFRGSLIEHFRSAPFVSPIPKDEAKQPDSTYVEKIATEEVSGENALPNNATVLEHINRSDPPNAEPTPLTKTTDKKRDWQNWDNSVLPPVFTLGTVETVIILGLVDLLFLSFVVIQVPYLFGGMEFIQSTPDFKLADYARRGFGELVAVAALVLPILLVSHWLLRGEVKRLKNIFRVLAGVQIALLFVIMASAVQRLVLLTGEFGYGMTTVRFYPMVFMLWLAVVFVWFALTVLRGSRQNFAWGALWAAVFILGAANLLNPDAFIARTNIQLMQQGRPFDAAYNAGQLSDDAVPAIIAALPEMSRSDQCKAITYLHQSYGELGQINDARSWNLSRQNAWDLLQANDAYMHQTEGCEAIVINQIGDSSY